MNVSSSNQPLLRCVANTCISAHFAARCRRGERYVAVRLPKVAIPLGNLVLEHDLVAKGVPGEIGKDPMVLVSIASRMREHEIRLNARRECPRKHPSRRRRPQEKTIAKSVEIQLLFGISTQEQACAAGRFLGAPRVTAEHGPMDLRAAGNETQNCPAASNLDIVGVSTQAKNAKRPPSRPCQ